MKWLDKQIEKMYLKKHPESKEPYVDPTKNECRISVKMCKPVRISSTVRVGRHELENLKAQDVYKVLLKGIARELDQCISIESSCEFPSDDILITGTLYAYRKEDDETNNNWLAEIKRGIFLV